MSHLVGALLAIVIFGVILVPQIFDVFGRRLRVPRGRLRTAMFILYLLVVAAVAVAALTLLTPGPEPALF